MTVGRSDIDRRELARIVYTMKEQFQPESLLLNKKKKML